MPGVRLIHNSQFIIHNDIYFAQKTSTMEKVRSVVYVILTKAV